MHQLLIIGSHHETLQMVQINNVSELHPHPLISHCMSMRRHFHHWIRARNEWLWNMKGASGTNLSNAGETLHRICLVKSPLEGAVVAALKREARMVHPWLYAVLTYDFPICFPLSLAWSICTCCKVLSRHRADAISRGLLHYWSFSEVVWL